MINKVFIILAFVTYISHFLIAQNYSQSIKDFAGAKYYKTTKLV